MPTFHDPRADASEAAEALRGLAHATQHVEDPRVLYPVIGEMMAATRNLAQVLDQLATAHQRHTHRATTDDGDRAEGAVHAHEAATALKDAAAKVTDADLILDRASSRAGRIAWQSDTPQQRWVSVVFIQGDEASPVLEMIDRQGTDAAIEFLAGWDLGDETTDAALENGYVYDAPPHTPADRLATRDVYALTYSHDLGYVGLSRQYDQLPDTALLSIDTPVPAPTDALREGLHRGPRRWEGSEFLPDAIAEVAERRGLTR